MRSDVGMADAPSKVTLLQRIRDAHIAAMDALRRRQDALLVRVIRRLDEDRAKKIMDDIKRTM